MSPEQVSVLTALFSVIKALSSWPFAVFFFALVVGPWVLAVMLAWSYRKQREMTDQESRERFESVVSMYENNVRLVEKYEKIASDLKDVVMVNTNTFATLTDAIKHNQFCPIVREKGGTG